MDNDKNIKEWHTVKDDRISKEMLRTGMNQEEIIALKSFMSNSKKHKHNSEQNKY